MCNDYRLEVDIASIAEDFDGLEINIDMPEGAPNVPAREDIRIAIIVLAGVRKRVIFALTVLTMFSALLGWNLLLQHYQQHLYRNLHLGTLTKKHHNPPY